jgi:transcriptional regulator with XRE-family HTH domain
VESDGARRALSLLVVDTEASRRHFPAPICDYAQEIVMPNPKSPNEIDVTVGRNVRRIRNLLGMSQETLAEKLGLTFQQVQKYEKGTNRISASKLVAVSQALDCSISQLFADVDASTNTVPVPIVSVAALKLAGQFDKISSPSQRDAVAKLVASLARQDVTHSSPGEE